MMDIFDNVKNEKDIKIKGLDNIKSKIEVKEEKSEKEKNLEKLLFPLPNFNYFMKKVERDQLNDRENIRSNIPGSYRTLKQVQANVILDKYSEDPDNKIQFTPIKKKNRKRRNKSGL